MPQMALRYRLARHALIYAAHFKAVNAYHDCAALIDSASGRRVADFAILS